MEQFLKNFAKEYDLDIDRKMYKDDLQRSVNNPVLFVFIGDGVREAYSHIESSISRSVLNGRGIAFINISSEHIEDRDNTFNYQFSYDDKDKKVLRKNIKEKFYNDKSGLEALNNKLITARDKILSNGSLFNSFESISISVITTADDVMNIILPDITILIRQKMKDIFKLSSVDLYVLIKENNLDDEVFSGAASVSFFREIEYMEKDDFKFNEKIAIFGQERELPVTFNGPLFYMVYVLEEKNEKGIIPYNSMRNNYEIICSINLLKNKNAVLETYADTENQHYDNSIFKRNIKDESSLFSYVTAGLSKVKRPNDIIAVTAVMAFYQRIIKEQKEASSKKSEFIADILKIDEESVASKVEAILPKGIAVEDMNGIMMNNTKDLGKKISGISLRQAEQHMYGDRCENFFNVNFINSAENNLRDSRLEREVKKLVEQDILSSPKLGLYCIYAWTSEEGEAVKYIRERCSMLERFKTNINSEIDAIYESKFIEGFNIKSLFTRGISLQEVRHKIFSEIYLRKLEALKLHISMEILKKYEDILLRVHEKLQYEVNELNNIDEIIKKYENELLTHQDEYAAQNVKAYYTGVVNSIVDKLEQEQGKAFYLEDKYIGSLSENIKAGKQQLLEKMVQFCNKFIFREEEFHKSFEEELNERANINISNFNSKVFSKEELYRKLYNILDESSALKSYIMNYDVKGYQEKYFIGDYSSDFIKYAFDFDRKTRNYKIGYIHERKSSGIEKINLMGGFRAKDIIYIKNGMDFYNYCLENGYSLHYLSLEKLPEIF